MTQQTSHATYSGGPAANYERYFVPAIGAPLAKDLVELAALRPGERVLDVACGTGVVTRLAAEQVDGGSVAGVDVNPGMVAIARRTSGDADIEWHEASAEALPLGDATFDAVLCQMGLQFFPDRPAALREMHRVLTPGGRVVVNVPGPTPPLFAPLEQALARHVGPAAAGFVKTVFSLYDPDEVRTLLRDAGFADVRVRAEPRTLRVPPAEEFLWQYVHSTPLAEAVSSLDDDRRAILQDEVSGLWEPFAENGALVLDVSVTSASGFRA